MARSHLVRIGALGQVGAFVAADGTCYPRGSRVVVRTARGLELGNVLTMPDAEDDHPAPDGSIVRRMSVEDHLLAARLEQNRDEAYSACTARIAERGLGVILMDVEQLFDGETFCFYFLGEPAKELDDLTAELAETYDAKVQFRRFVEAAVAGCGPGCGTDEATGGGCDSCATGCAVASACSTRGSRAAG